MFLVCITNKNTEKVTKKSKLNKMKMKMQSSVKHEKFRKKFQESINFNNKTDGLSEMTAYE